MIVFYFNIISFNLYGKAEFTVFTVSYDPSEIILICWFAAQDTFIINVENGFTT